MIGILVYCASFVIIGYCVTRWSDQRAKDKEVWLYEEVDVAFWIAIVAFISVFTLDPWVSQVIASLFAGYIMRVYWVYIQLIENGESDDFEAKE